LRQPFLEAGSDALSDDLPDTGPDPFPVEPARRFGTAHHAIAPMWQPEAYIRSCELSSVLERAHSIVARKTKGWLEHEIRHAAVGNLLWSCIVRRDLAGRGEGRMTAVLVAGGAGFIGSHLCEQLLQDGYEVVCVDNCYTGKTQNIIKCLLHPRFAAMSHDVVLPLHAEVGQIYNLACPASPVHYQRDPVQTMKTSVHGAVNLLDLAKRVGARILQASTSEVYGDSFVHPQIEDYWGNVNPIGRRACYDEGKRCAETLFFDYRRQHAVDARVARIFNTYGPSMHPKDGRVVPSFIMQALAGEPITIYGDGSQTRSFCHVSDLISSGH
jgi:dTDP-4-dehydrorhamnose reductase